MSDPQELARLLSQQPTDPAQQNAPFTQPGEYNTQLPQLQEMAFRQWVANNQVPFNPNAKQSDYDMRGFYQGIQQQNPQAVSAVNTNDGRMHYPDYWKTPQHQTFSGESKFAGPVAPMWNPQDQLIAPSGRILFDERKPR